MYEMVRGTLDGDLAWQIGDMLAHRSEWWVPGKIVELRHRLKPYWQVRRLLPADSLQLLLLLRCHPSCRLRCRLCAASEVAACAAVAVTPAARLQCVRRPRAPAATSSCWTLPWTSI